jgi:hypothetical protein
MGTENPPRCKAIVYRRDTYRVDRRAKSGFSMYYAKGRCNRPAGPDGFCWQHRGTRVTSVDEPYQDPPGSTRCPAPTPPTSTPTP